MGLLLCRKGARRRRSLLVALSTRVLFLLMMPAVARGEVLCPECGVERCTFNVRIGLHNATAPTLELRRTPGKVTLQPHNSTSLFHDDDDDRRLLCLFERPVGDVALLMTANSLDYVFRMWPLFVHKVVWALEHGLRPALWIGGLPKELATTVGGDCADSKELKETTTARKKMKKKKTKESLYLRSFENEIVSNHHAKILASSALLDEPEVRSFFYVDLDAAFRRETRRANTSIFDVETYDVDVLFGSTNFAFWHVKSYVFYLRESTLARQLLAAWLRFRCGYKDQFALWHAVLTLAADYGCLDYHGELFTNFTYRSSVSHTHAALKPFPNLGLTCRQRAQRCPNFKFCRPFFDLGHQAEFHHYTIQANARRHFHYLAEDDDDDLHDGKTKNFSVDFQDSFIHSTFDDLLNTLGLADRTPDQLL